MRDATHMPIDPNLDVDLDDFFAVFAGLPSYADLGPVQREEIHSFARLALVTNEDDNVRMATTLLSAMARLEENPDTVG